MTPTHRYAWKNTPDRAARYGQPCAVRIRSRRMRTVCVEFPDGFRMATSERALRGLPAEPAPRLALDPAPATPARPGFETFESARARNLAAGGSWFASEGRDVWPVLQRVAFRELNDEVLPGGFILACDEKMRYRRTCRPPWNVYRIDGRGRVSRVAEGPSEGGWWERCGALEYVLARAKEAAEGETHA